MSDFMYIVKRRLLRFYIRFTEVSPKYFLVMKWIALTLIPTMAIMVKSAPQFDFIIFTLYEGTDHQRRLWFSEAVAMIAAGVAFASAQVVRDYDKYKKKLEELSVKKPKRYIYKNPDQNIGNNI